MKFGKSLSNQIEETLPEWRDKFLSYKDLKKRLKLVEPNKAGERPNKRPRFDESTVAGDDNKASDSISREEIDFLSLLEDEMDKFNTFFVEKEEEYVIRLKVNLSSQFFFRLIRWQEKITLISFCFHIKQTWDNLFKFIRTIISSV